MLKNVFVSNLTGTVNYTTAAQPTDLTTGQIGVYSVATTGALTLITTTPSATQLALPILVACGTGNGQFKSVTIQPYTTKGYVATAYAAPVPNVFVVGYDGVTASYALQSGAAGTYDFKIQNLTLGNPPFPTVGSTPFFQTNAAATQSAIAQAIVKDVNTQMLLSNNDVMPANRFAFATMLSAASSVQLVTSAPANITGTFVNGSVNVTLSGSTAGGTTVLNVGDFLRVGSATATTAPVYRVASVSGTSVVLDSPYVNPEAAVGATISGVALGYIAAASANSANAGIRVVEFGNIFNGSNVLEPQPNKILNVSCSMNLSGTPVQNNQVVARAYTAANGTITSGVYTEGSGTYPMIFKAELFAAGYGGFINRSFLPDRFPLYANSANTYTTLGIQYFAPAKDYTAQGFVAGDTLDLLIALGSATGTQYSTLNTIFSTYK